MKIVAVAGMAPITKNPPVPEPTATIEFELASPEAVQEAVEEMKARGQQFVHESRMEPWGQTVARFMSPEGVLIGLSYAPHFHA